MGTTSVAAPKASSSSTAIYSLTARPAASGGSPFSPSIPFCRLASALIRLASIAKASPPTSPSRMQRCRTVSKTRRSRSLSRKLRVGPSRRWNDRAHPPSARAGRPSCSQLRWTCSPAPLEADPEAVADDQHPDHQLGINRGPSQRRRTARARGAVPTGRQSGRSTSANDPPAHVHRAELSTSTPVRLHALIIYVVPAPQRTQSFLSAFTVSTSRVFQRIGQKLPKRDVRCHVRFSR